MVSSVYFDSAFRKRDEVIERTTETIKRLQDAGSLPKDLSIAFRGMSGAVVAPVIAYTCGLGLIVVRKPNDSSHSNNRVEGDADRDYIIVDDFICGGETVREIFRAIADVSAKNCRGIIVYEREYDYNEITIRVDEYDAEGEIVPVWFAGEERPRAEDHIDFQEDSNESLQQ